MANISPRHIPFGVVAFGVPEALPHIVFNCSISLSGSPLSIDNLGSLPCGCLCLFQVPYRRLVTTGGPSIPVLSKVPPFSHQPLVGENCLEGPPMPLQPFSAMFGASHHFSLSVGRSPFFPLLYVSLRDALLSWVPHVYRCLSRQLRSLLYNSRPLKTPPKTAVSVWVSIVKITS